MAVFQHFPLQKPVFEHQFGISALDADRPILFRGETYDEEIVLRQESLASNFRESYLQENETGNSVVREFVALMGDRSDVLQCRDEGVSNLVKGDLIDLESITLSWIGERVQEDIAILSDDASQGFPIIAGCVCFPSGWSIKDKLGQSMLFVHREVPEFDRVLFPPTDKLLQRMKVGRTVWRTNWGVRPSAQLDQSPRHLEMLRSAATEMRSEDAGERCFFRVEFQTLTRVPSGSIVFTIRTEQCSLAELTDWQRSNLRGVLKTCPQETMQYKGIAPMKDALLEYLSASC